MALVIALQNATEFPRDGITALLGRPLTGLLVFLALGASLALLLVALRERLPRWRWLRSRRVQVALLVVTLAACPTGLKQVGSMAVSGFLPPNYPNDGTVLDHAAAQQLLDGHNPYVTTDIVSALRQYGQSDATHTTPLRQRAFAGIPPNSYPTKQQLQSVFAREPAGQPDKVVEFETRVSYPALAFLPLVPFVWAGFPSVAIFFALCFVALAVLFWFAAPPELRPWVALLTLADAPLVDAAVGGVLDVFYILLVYVAWRFWRRPLLSTVFLGLAISAKQLAWFFLPFYAILIWRAYGWRAMAKRLAGAGALFLLINGPFLVNNPQAWLDGVLAPQRDPMFALGYGIVRLSLAGLLPLAPSWLYTALELLAIGGAVVWYWRFTARSPQPRPEIGFALALLPLFFAYRSLATYFYFIALPAFALWLAFHPRRTGVIRLGAARPGAQTPGRMESGMESGMGGAT